MAAGRTFGDDLLGALAVLNRSIPGADELADGAQAAANVLAGRAPDLATGWSQARAASRAAVQGFQQAHPHVAALTRGTGLALQAAPFLLSGGETAAPAVVKAATSNPGMIGAAGRLAASAAKGAVLGGVGAQVGGLASEGSPSQRVQAANAATPPAMALGAVIPPVAGVIGAGVRAFDPKPLVSLTGEEIAPLDASHQDLLSATRGYYNANLRGSATPLGGNPDEPIGYIGAGRNKITSGGAYPNKLRATAALPTVIESGKISQQPPYKDVPDNVTGFSRAEGPISIAGEDMMMRSIIRHTEDGSHHYDHSVRPAPTVRADPGLIQSLLNALAFGQGASQPSEK